MPEPSVLGRNLARLRDARGWSQSALARRSGVSQSFISNLEGGRSTESLVGTVQALALALGVTVDDLLRVESPVPPREEPSTATGEAVPSHEEPSTPAADPAAVQPAGARCPTCGNALAIHDGTRWLCRDHGWC
jgi:transcriptional regulator with XRE-family HTH domain